MNSFFKNHFLYFCVFITGACVLVLEIMAVRVLSPYFGNTIFTVSSIISVILLALSVGYYIGGKYADKNPSSQIFFLIIALSGICVFISHIFSILLLPKLSSFFSITTGPLFSSLLLFLFPALLMGMLSPFAIKLQTNIQTQQGIGNISGKMFFFSTLGSILGSLLTGFILIPNLGIQKIYQTVGFILFFLGFIPWFYFSKEKKRFFLIILFAFTASVSLNLKEALHSSVIYTKEGIYEKISIEDTKIADRPARIFKQDRSYSSAMFLDTNDPTDLVFNYTKYHVLYKIFKPEIENILVIGGGTYTLPKALNHEIPKAQIDVAEIEPSLFDISKNYFQLTKVDQIKNISQDGRRLLSETKHKYDYIFSDVYYSFYSIPVHFTTVEFFDLAKSKLSENGIFVANIIGNLSDEKFSFLFSEIKTFQSIFPNSYFFAVESIESKETQNIIFVGYNSDKKINFSDPKISNHENQIIRSLQKKQILPEKYDLDSYQILTDDHAPVEFLASKLLQKSF